jgi:hypothetical protein
MPGLAHPPRAPLYTACDWVTPLKGGILFTYVINPNTGTYCPPWVPGVGAHVLAGTERYTLDCTQPFAISSSCSDPDFQHGVDYAITTASTVDDLPRCSRNWVGPTCGSGFATWDGECATCTGLPTGGGITSWYFNPEDCLCYPDYGAGPELCPPGNCWCATTGNCISCTDPSCPGVTECNWNSAYCRFECDGLPHCDPGDGWDPATCSCVELCTPGNCWCEGSSRCINCEDPDCAVELNCAWNEVLCEWECDDPQYLCDTGYDWEPSLCECVPECPDGECWCQLSTACVDCSSEPECKEELNCEWDATICDWVCDDPDTKCGTRTWLGEPDCRCEGGGGVWNLHIPIGHYFVVDDLAGGITVQRAEDTVPPFTLSVAVTGDSADRAPRMIRDWDGRLVLVWIRGSDALESVSDDDGETWQAEATIFMSVSQVDIAKDRNTGLKLRSARDTATGEISVTREYPGDATPSASFPALVNPGATPLVLDDTGFHLSHAPEGPGRWLLVGVDTGEVVNYASADDGATWELTP